MWIFIGDSVFQPRGAVWIRFGATQEGAQPLPLHQSTGHQVSELLLRPDATVRTHIEQMVCWWSKMADSVLLLIVSCTVPTHRYPFIHYHYDLMPAGLLLKSNGIKVVRNSWTWTFICSFSPDSGFCLILLFIIRVQLSHLWRTESVCMLFVILRKHGYRTGCYGINPRTLLHLFHQRFTEGGK